MYLLVGNRTYSNLDPDSNPDPELITDPDPNLQIISDPAGSGSGCTTLPVMQVENVVAESLHSSMQGTSLNVFRRFSQLWHLSRDLTTTTRRSLGRPKTSRHAYYDAMVRRYHAFVLKPSTKCPFFSPLKSAKSFAGRYCKGTLYIFWGTLSLESDPAL